MFILCPCLGVACLWDYETGRVPNFLQFIIFGLGLIYTFSTGGETGALFYLIKAAVMILIGFPLFRLSMIGAGDVKLIALAAGFFPAKSILWFVFYIFLSAALFSIFGFAVKKNLKERFLYLFKYMTEVSKTGELKAYNPQKSDMIKGGIVMSGPVLISALMYWGGVY